MMDYKNHVTMQPLQRMFYEMYHSDLLQHRCNIATGVLQTMFSSVFLSDGVAS